MGIKITNVDIHVIKSDLDVPFAFSQGWVNKRSATLVEIKTNEGIIGWGEAFCQGLEPPEISAAVIETALKPLLLNQSPLDIEVLWHKMYNNTRDFGRKGSVISGISAIDIALWDILGKYHNQPIHQLLGGAFRTKIKPYATGFYRIKGQGEAKRLAEEALSHFENKFDHMKVKLGFGIQDDIKCMEAIYKVVENKNVTLMIDTNHAYGRSEALMLGVALKDYNLRWYEEPVVPEDIKGYVELKSKLDVPIAGGENEHTLYGFRSLFENGAIDIAQPDIGSCGGISGARHIINLAQSFGVEVNPHVWGSAIAQAASIQVIASIPYTHHSIFARSPILEYDQSSHPFRRELLKSPLELDDGMINVSAKPGLGIDVNMATIKKYKCN
ncbi:MAG: mandelate racemase/muconate lactonizing enzyme family protein [Candidatus Puniceispirillales bacterium]|jgi:D-galactarolactone cycloisomerase|nr:mandelate racemase/muconate lactonizing enzyme family protein [Alphaproteobacteria bacterium]MDA0915763.1 mandelate racemase/muconate lactonizing enzyme family protein [Pseudomonadota bacterium]